MIKPNFKNICIIKIQQLVNFPFIEQDFDSLTNYGFLCKIVEKLNEIVNNDKTQNDAILELYNNFIELKNYIDNLDLQDEVNNRLDEYVEDGTLERLIENIKFNDWIDPLSEGAVGDGITDDSDILQSCINRGNVRLSKGKYFISKSIIIPSNKIFDGGQRTIIPGENVTAFKFLGQNVNNPVVNTTLKNLIIDTNNAGSNGIDLQNGYFNYFDNINIARLTGNNTFGIKITNGFNHVIKNSRVLGNKTYVGQKGLWIIATNNLHDGIENMTNCKYDTLLLQNLEFGVKTEYNTTANTIIFDNLGFSNNTYMYHLTGYANPIKISNSRMESNVPATGFYINGSINLTIDSLNAYNISSVIDNTNTMLLNIIGSVALTGTNQSTKYLFIKNSNNNINSSAIYNVLSTTYNFSTSTSFTKGAFLNSNEIFFNDTTSNTLNLGSASNFIVKVTQNLLSIYGPKGAKARLWTDSENIVIFGKANSQTNKWTGTITMEPYKFYDIFMVDSNQAMISN